MTSDRLDLNQFVVAQLDAAYRWIEGAADGLTDEQLFTQPTSDTNSIAWLAWHLSRVRDWFSATISGEPELWVAEGWAERFGVASERTGLGDTPEQVASFRVDRDVLLGYAEAAHRSIVECVSNLTPEQLEQPITLPSTGDVQPAWRALARVVGDSTQHVGQINYLRGMITGLGWR